MTNKHPFTLTELNILLDWGVLHEYSSKLTYHEEILLHKIIDMREELRNEK